MAKKARKAKSRPKASRARAKPKSGPRSRPSSRRASRAARRPRVSASAEAAPKPFEAESPSVPREKIKLLVDIGSASGVRSQQEPPAAGVQADRCSRCGAPFNGFLPKLLGLKRSASNPSVCNKCEKKA
jgi:hypothetical protein